MRTTGRRRWRVTSILVVAALAVAACAGDDSGEPAPELEAEPSNGAEEPEEGDDPAVADEPAGTADLTIVATTSILGDIVGHLVGDDGEVTVLMDPGVDPHAYQPSAADAALLREADLVIANGLMLEENLLAALEAAAEEGVPVVELADHLDPIGFEEHGDGHSHDEDDGHSHDDDHGQAHDEDDHGHDDEEDDHGHDGHSHGPEDPHIWFDPVRMADGVELIADELAQVSDVVDAEEWRARGETYRDELLTVHDEMDELFATIPDERRYLVTNHDALGYLAHRYGFTVLGTVIPGATTQAETDARAFAELIETVEETGVPAIFAENTDSTVLAEQLASEVVGRGDLDVEVVGIYSDALGEEGSGAETYLGLLRTTAQRITDALA